MSSADNPFEGMPFFGDIMKMFANQGPVNWDGARQLAVSIATEGESEDNVNPMERITFEQLSRVAELQVADATRTTVADSGALEIVPVTRSEWALTTLDSYRPYIESLAAALHDGDVSTTDITTLGPQGDPEAMFKQVMGMLTPVLVGMTTGSMVGHLATRSFGVYDPPIPRGATDKLMVVAPNIAQFAQDWSLDGNDIRLWICLDQTLHHSVFKREGIGSLLRTRLMEYVGAFEPNRDGAVHELMDFGEDFSGDPMSQFQQMFTNPEVLLGANRTPRQDEIRPQVETLLAVVSGYVDFVMDRIGPRLVGSYRQITEAMHRERTASSESDRFVERLFGIDLTEDLYEKGRAFIEGLAERAGDEIFESLWTSGSDLPTPNELSAPGLWLARVGIDTFDADAEVDLSGLDELLGEVGENGSDESGDSD